MTEEWSTGHYESHWGPVLADMLRQIAGELRDIADDVNDESADELREMATEIEDGADYYDRGKGPDLYG